MQNEDFKQVILAALDLAFEAGKWDGQRELEEHYDTEQYSSVAGEVLSSRKTGMPEDKASVCRTVKINLRSDDWRKRVIKSSQEYKDRAYNIILDYIQQCKKIEETYAE